jgi:hypothetical protein
MNRFDVYQMIQRRAKAAGIDGSIGCHTFRATGIRLRCSSSDQASELLQSIDSQSNIG